MNSEQKIQTACFAGGCFWCTASAFDGVEGVEKILSGYTGGQVENPSYEQVCTGRTGHVEALEIQFDPEKVSYWELLERFFRQIDPTDDGGSFVDRGSQYTSAVFFHSPEQEAQAREMVRQLESSGLLEGPVATQILEAAPFYPAEDHHQNYHNTHTVQYKFYRLGSGRDSFIKKFWEEGPGKDFKFIRPGRA